jgi:hypothetical protein
VAELASRVLGLEVVVEGADLEQLELPLGEWTRRTTVIHLRGGGHEGLGEDVTYQPEEHEDPPRFDLAGTQTLAELSRRLDDVELFSHRSLDAAAPDYRRWAWESAALDLALTQNGLTLGAAVGREPRPVTYVVSTRAENVRPLLERYPDMRFKLDPSQDWGDELFDALAATGRVDTADYKGVYRGDFGFPADPDLYARVAEAFPGAWLEDPGLTEETDRVLEQHRDRITWDAPIHSWADVEALPFPPKCLNVKPSRFGTIARLFEFYAACEANGIALYGGGQFELGPGRAQIQELAALFHPDGPNDVAPGMFNAAPVPDDAPASPLEPPRAFGTKS